jgi:SNF2 family DNA or RNA helicase
VVFAPLRPVYSVWPSEQEKWADFKDLSVGILHGKNKEDVLLEDHDIYVINYESIDWLTEHKGSNVLNSKNMKLLLSKVDVLIFDELSRMKHTNTKRFKALKPWLGKFERRWGLTGSPAPNGLMDLFGQCYVLDLGRSLGQYITHYRNRYFYPSGYGGYSWSLQEGADVRIQAAVKPMALRMEAEDYLKMPKVINVPIYVELPPAARKVYEEMEDDLFTEIEGEEFVAATVSSASIKCQQIANGALYKDKMDPLTGLPVHGKREWQQLHTAKLDALQELIDELQGQPCLFGYHFGHDLERIIATLGKNTPHMDVSPKLFEKLKNQWNANELPYLFGHPASMGHGINLQEGQANHVGWFNIPWDYDQYDQFIRRVRRQGNNADTIFVYHIIAKGTIDEAKMRALTNKGKGQKALLDALKTYRRAKGVTA